MILQQLETEMNGLGMVELCGSRVTCNPIPEGADWDYLIFCYTEAGVRHMVNYLGSEGYQWESSEHYQQVAGNGFMSWRKGDTNILLTSNQIWLDLHHQATELCRLENILDKEERIRLFQKVLYNSSDTEIGEILHRRRERLAKGMGE